jgi:Na+/phosphate symporter
VEVFFVCLKVIVSGHNFTLQGSTKTKEELKSLEKQIAERHKKQRDDKKGSGEKVVYYSTVPYNCKNIFDMAFSHFEFRIF